MEMTQIQRETVEMVQATLPTFLAYQNPSNEDTAVLLMDPSKPEDIIAVDTDGVTNEFVSGEWRSGWES